MGRKQIISEEKMTENKTIDDNVAKAEEHLRRAEKYYSEAKNDDPSDSNYFSATQSILADANYHATMASNYLLKTLIEGQRKKN